VIEEKLLELEKEIEFYQKEKQNMKKQSQALTKQFHLFEKEKQNFKNFKLEQVQQLEKMKNETQKNFKNLTRNLENKFVLSTKKKKDEKKQIEYLTMMQLLNFQKN
jgi:hypothetical protein